MNRSGVRHVLQIAARLHVGQILKMGASTSAGIFAHELQEAYLLPWNVAKVSYENCAMC